MIVSKTYEFPTYGLNHIAIAMENCNLRLYFYNYFPSGTLMKKLVWLIAFVVMPIALYGQGFALYGIDTTAFPKMKAKFTAYDTSGVIHTSISDGNISLTENGTPRTVTNVSCPQSTAQVAVSAVLTIDVSGSMSFGFPNIDLAKSAASSFIKAMHLGTSECAVSSFDHENFLNQDFTTDRVKLLAAVNSLLPRGGTDHDQGLRLPPAGGLHIAKNGKFKRILIYLTDGEGAGNQDSIIAFATRLNTTIYAVSLGIPAPKLLREISEKTGGTYYENIRTTAQAEAVYLSILQEIEQFEPCSIEWQSAPDCLPLVAVQASIPGLGLTADARYERPKSGSIAMNFAPLILEFGAGVTGTPMTLKTRLTASGSAITIDSIVSNDPRFTVLANTTFTLQPGESREVSVQFTPTDSGYAFANFRVLTNVCSPFYFYATGGFSDRSPSVRTLNLTAPNGLEVFGVGADTIITWEGVTPSDSIRIELSTDASATWTTIDRGAGGLRKLWNVGNTPSTQCLIRVSQLGRSFPAPFVLAGHTDHLLDAEFNHDGTRAVTSGEDRKAIVWDATTGTSLFRLEGHKSIVYSAVFSSDGQYILTASFDQSAKLWDAATGAELLQFGSPIELSAAAFQKSGKVAVTGNFKGGITLWDITTGKPLKVLSAKDDSTSIASLDVSPNGASIVSVSKSGNVTMWNVGTGKRQVFPVSSSDYPYTVRFSQDGNKFVTGGPNSAIVWDAASMSQIRSYRSGNTKVTAAAMSPDGALLATASSNQGDSTFVSIIVWSLASGDSLYALHGHGGQINTIAFSPDGRRLISSSIDQSARIWELGSAVVVQQDTSDRLFTIMAPAPLTRPLDLGEIPVGISRDSILPAVLQNKEILPVRIDSISISGANAAEFSVVSPQQFSIAPATSTDIEFECKPLAVGVRLANVTFFTPGGKYTVTIQATGVQGAVSVPSQVIDFGKVRVLNFKDSTIDIFLKNTTSAPITITSIRTSGPDSVQFSIVSAGGSITLTAGETKPMTLRFAPIIRGRTSGSIVVEYQGIGSPMKVRLFGEGVVTELGFATAVDIPTLTCSNDTIVNFPFQNISDVPVALQKVEFIGANASEFSWVGSLPSSPILSGTISKGAIRFTPVSAGEKNALMVLTASGFSVKSDTIALHARKDSVGFSLIGEVADSVIVRMTVSQQFVSQDTLITIVNHGSIPLEWNVPFSLGNFSFVEVQPPVTPVGGSSLVRVRFDGGSVGNYYAPSYPLLENRCGRMKRFNLQANVIPSAPTVLSIGSGAAAIGEILEIPLVITNVAGLKEAKVAGIEGVIRCNGTLLLPLPPADRGIYSGDTVRIRFTAQIGTDSVLMRLRFRAALGNDTATQLVIERAAATFGNARISTTNGKFTLLGICRDGAVPRLFRLANKSSVTVTPQPIHSSALVHYEAGEAGNVRITLTNLLGIDALTIAGGEFAIGAHDIPFSTEHLPASVYFLRIETPTQTLVQRVDVGK